MQKDLEKEDFEIILKYLEKEKKENFLDFEILYAKIEKDFSNIANKIKNSLMISKQISPLLSTGLNGNPRQCKRFLNSMSMREQMAASRGIQLDRQVLVKLMLLEYFEKRLFDKISMIQFNKAEKKNELKLLEDRKTDELEELKAYIDDEWVKNWCEVQPKLGDKDLREYFYFAREALNIRSYSEELGISTTGKNILEMLLSDNAINEKEALDKSNDLGDLDLHAIMQILFSKLLEKGEVQNKKFKIFINFGAKHQSLHSSIIEYCKLIPIEKYVASQIPLLVDFAKEKGKEKELNELFADLEIKNPKVNKALQSYIKMKEGKDDGNIK
jgi:hypothetical protein